MPKHARPVAWLAELFPDKRTKELALGELQSCLAAVFNRLREANLKLKPSKVRLFQREIKFLGNIVSGQGITVNDSKVMEITKWSIPRNVYEIRSFLGICSYYRCYVKDFAAHATPLHELTKKDIVYEWNENRQAAFDFSRMQSLPHLY